MSSERRSDNQKPELYRDPFRGKICGVCVGIADYFGLEIWVVRITAVSALIFFGFPIFLAYVVAYLVIDPKPGTSQYDKFRVFRAKVKVANPFTKRPKVSPDGDVGATVKQVWKKGRIPGRTLKNINKKFQSLETRLQTVESYVTSKQFELHKEFQDLSS